MSHIRSAGMRFALTERIYYSRNHAQAAARSAREAGKLEQRLVSDLHEHGRSWSWEDRDLLWSHVTISVISAAACLEAAINELYGDASDIAKQHPHYKASLYAALDPSVAEDLAFVWEIADKQAEPLQRYQLALTTGRVARLDAGRQPFQECRLIVRLRNILTHSRPEWLGVDSSKLGDQLAGHFEISPLSHEGSPFVPYKALSYGCAVWAVKSSVRFIDEFFARWNLPSPLDEVRSRLATRVGDGDL